MIVLLTALIWFGTTIAAIAQSPSAEAIAASGGFSGQMYSNPLLEFSMLAPGGWNFFTPDQNKAVVARHRENASVILSAGLEDAAVNTQVLFQATPPAYGGQDKTALFSCGVERLKKSLTTEKYIEVNQGLVLKTPGVKVIKDTYAVVYGGVKFSGFDVEGSAGKVKYRQRYLAAVRKDAALFFVITLYDDKQDQIIDYSLKSMKFGKQLVR